MTILVLFILWYIIGVVSAVLICISEQDMKVSDLFVVFIIGIGGLAITAVLAVTFYEIHIRGKWDPVIIRKWPRE